jgi:hypothetical protein
MFKKNRKKIIKEKGDELCEKYKAIGIAEGHKITKGKDTGKDAIVLIVKHKLPETALLKEEKIPSKIDRWDTDVISAGGDIEPMHRKKYRPVQGGISGKVEGGTACSIGMVCWKGQTKGILTNEHCFHYPSLKDNSGKRFTQPSRMDGGTVNDSIGICNTPPQIRNDKVNKVDSVFIPLDINNFSNGADGETTLKGIGHYPREIIEPQVGMKFISSSRTTGMTRGTISHVNVMAHVNYKGDVGVCKFFPCIFALQDNYNIINGGDSGSIIVLDEKGNEKVIGQVFAASPNLAIFIPMSSIVDELGISLEPSEERYFVAAGRDWYVEPITGKTKTTVRLNLRKEPRVSDDTYIKTLPIGTEIDVIRYVGRKDGYEWLEIKVEN